MIKRISSLVLKGIALAMAVAVIVLHTLGALTSETTIAMLAIGLAALALESLQKTDSASTKK